ncbi:MAG: PEGA domain-containing protein [Betaproteobacteria bacterium]
MDSASADRPAPAAPGDQEESLTPPLEVRDSAAPLPESPEAESLDGFLAEEPEHTAPADDAAPGASALNRVQTKWLMAGVAAALVVSTVAAARLRIAASPDLPEASGTLTIDSKPSGAAVAIDGRDRGRTPLTLSLQPGAHQMTLVNGAEQRSVPLSIVAGRQMSEYFEFAPGSPAVTTGTLSVTADVAGSVSIDGHARGSTPLEVTDLAAGEHLVSITSKAGTIDRTVTVQPGATSAAAFSFAKPPGPVAGWVFVSAPFDVQVFEGADRVASSGTKVMLAAGGHDVKLVNDALGYSETRHIDVTAGKISAIRVDAPQSTLSANAQPWANVSIDGTDVGQTPLANVPITIGTHEVVFRHPQFGEQRRTVTVTAKGPNRISADLTKK